MINKTLLISLFLLPFSANALEFHGFASQAAIKTSDNNFSGQSSDQVSFDRSEIGLNFRHEFNSQIRLSGQGLYRRVGSDPEQVFSVDYLFVDWQFLRGERQAGLLLGRSKVAIGFYNKTRDVAHTRPGILLPQVIYADKFRSVYLSSDGATLYANQALFDGFFSVEAKLGYPIVNKDGEELKAEILPPGAQGQLNTRPSAVLNVLYEGDAWDMGMTYLYGNINFESDTSPMILFGDADLNFNAFIGSLAWHWHEWVWTNELNYSDNGTQGFEPGASAFALAESSKSIAAYSQLEYYFARRWNVLARFEYHQAESQQDLVDKLAAVPGPFSSALMNYRDYSSYTRDWVATVNWDMSYHWRVSAEYHNVDGTSILPASENPLSEGAPTRYWQMFLLQAAYRF